MIHPLPNRRPCIRYTFKHDGQTCHGTVGLRAAGYERPDSDDKGLFLFDPTVGDLYLEGGPPGSDFHSGNRDAGIYCSKAIEGRRTIGELAAASTLNKDGTPASAMGTFLTILAAEVT